MIRRLGLLLASIIFLTAAGCDRIDLSTLETGDQILVPPITAGEAPKIRVVGSSTVGPFANAVAEQFGAVSGFPTPIVEVTGTGGGFKAFCAGTGPDEPSISDASREMLESERGLCASNGVSQITEIRIGYDGIVLAGAKTGPDFSLTKTDLYHALARELPDGQGGFMINPNRSWRDVGAHLPDEPILVFGPPPTSGTRDALAELGLEVGAMEDPFMAALAASDPEVFRDKALTIRTDGAWIDFGENDSAIIQSLLKTPGALGVLGFSFLERNADRVKAAKLSGVDAEFEHIKSGAYGLSRLLFVYVKCQNLNQVPGLVEFLEEFLSEAAVGPDGYLIEKGLIPLSDDDIAAQREKVSGLQPVAGN
ncbi:MAG: substrate-binding domain-containing protein [Hyphomonas sp.]|nr:substrate-binding domain-containing protein [Hyphomonas sp.]